MAEGYRVRTRTSAFGVTPATTTECLVRASTEDEALNLVRDQSPPLDGIETVREATKEELDRHVVDPGEVVAVEPEA